MKTPAVAVIIVFALSLAAFQADAQTVKKWVDEQGVTHYSDQNPVRATPEVEEIDVPEVNITEFESEETNERIQTQLRQLEQDREAREREAQEKEQTRALEESIEREPLVVEEKKKKKKAKKYRGPYPMPISERHRRLR